MSVLDDLVEDFLRAAPGGLEANLLFSHATN
jgi:hypothetical protein